MSIISVYEDRVCKDCAAEIASTMKAYVDEACDRCSKDGLTVSVAKIRSPRGYQDGAILAPLGFEQDEFCGVWFVEFGLAVRSKFLVHRLDLGQARFRFSTVTDVRYPGAIRENEAKVRRDNLITALDDRFGPDNVNIAATGPTEAARIWQYFWPTE